MVASTHRTSCKILTIVGARPQFIKAVAVSKALLRYSKVQEVMVHTGQHFDQNMSDIFFNELKIPKPTYNLAIHGGLHGQMTGRMLESIENVMKEEKPDVVLVYGDTNSTLAGALAAAKLHIPVCHVEAGLRSFNKRMPEEINRLLTDHMSTLLFCPTLTSVSNLEQEGINQGIYHVGDVMYDVVLQMAPFAKERSTILQRLELEDRPYALATIHRAENTDSCDQLQNVIHYLNRESEIQNLKMVLPLHPRTKIFSEKHGVDFKNLLVCEPLGYLDLQRLLQGAKLVFTDSGGLQKEAYFHQVPCVTLRNETEWVETITYGWNRLWNTEVYAEPRVTIPDYGSGKAAECVVETMENTFHF